MADGAAGIPERMCAVLLTGHGGFDRLEYRTDVPVPRAGPGEVLIRVAAAARRPHVPEIADLVRIGGQVEQLAGPP